MANYCSVQCVEESNKLIDSDPGIATDPNTTLKKLHSMGKT